MSAPPSHEVDGADELRHPPGPEPLWGESYYADFVSEDGSLAGYIRLGLYPNLGVSWWTAMIVGPGRPMVASVAYDLPLPAESGLSVADGRWNVACDITRPLEAFGVRASGPASVHHDPAAPFLGDPGEPTDVAMDLTWTTDGSPYHYLLTTRYEIPCDVEGELVVGGDRHAVRGHGQRDHSWGVRDWWVVDWCWASARLTDGTRVHISHIRLPGGPVGFGYVQTEGTVATVTSLSVTEDLGDHGLPRSATIDIQPGDLSLQVEPVAYGPLLLTAADGRTSRFPRAQMRVTAADGRRGEGWIEWNWGAASSDAAP